ncbi:MAG TPA: dynamin family protein [Thermoanaerobaculia bacterium]|nr:dynamin family protein [Thermoanaerobaculia bacterium]
MLRRILDRGQDDLVAAERRLLAELGAALVRCAALAADQATLRRAALQLDELFLLVVAGEFNSGKSAFINALLGGQVLEEGVTPTTTRVHVLRYGAEVGRAVTRDGEAALEVVTAPVELLREIHIVDTPGTNAIHREHEAITRDFVPRSDLVLFVTSADRPFTESERAFLQSIREWGKKVVVVVNKIDILEEAADVERIRAFIGDHARALLGFAPDIFPLSARQALRAKTGGDPELLARSRFGELERYISATLDEKERLRLKLLNPLGVGARLAQNYREAADRQLALLADDFTAIEDIERQLAMYREDMAREFRFRLADADNVLHEFEGRGMAFFDETLRLGRVVDLLNRARIKAEFEKKVVADVPQMIERRVHEVIDWLLSSDLRQWQAVMEHVAKRRHAMTAGGAGGSASGKAAGEGGSSDRAGDADRANRVGGANRVGRADRADRIVGQVGGAFDLDRSRLLDSVGRVAQETLDGYDKEAEATRMADSVQAAVASTALVEVGAIGLGTLLAHVLAGAAADATGVLAASVIALLGLFIIPSRRQAAKRELRARIAALRGELMTALTSQFGREIERSLRRIDEAIAPYTRFIRAERKRLEASRDELSSLLGELAGLRRRAESL